MPTHLALLRAINVGGRNVVPMAALRELFVSQGHGDVRTYIQSGNVVFTPAAGTDAATLGPALEARIRATFGFGVPVVLRTEAELAAVVAGNPFLAEGAAPATVHVGFLRDLPAAADVAALDPDRSPGDRFVVVGRDVYLHCPRGVAPSKLTADWFDRRLHTVLTARNWNTVTTLLAWLRG